MTTWQIVGWNLTENQTAEGLSVFNEKEDRNASQAHHVARETNLSDNSNRAFRKCRCSNLLVVVKTVRHGA